MGLGPPVSKSTYEQSVGGPQVGRIVFAEGAASKTDRAVRLERRLAAHRVRDRVTALIPRGNPNPRRFTVERCEVVGNGLVAVVVYPDCTTFEGRKILVFDRVSEARLRAAEVLDPHFCRAEDVPEGAVVPVARYVPSAVGWRLARIGAAAL